MHVNLTTIKGRSHVEVTSAFALSNAQEKSISESMSKRLGTEVDVSVTVDKSLIGGVVIRAGNADGQNDRTGGALWIDGSSAPVFKYCRMVDNRVRHLLIFGEDGGVVSIRDVLEALAD